MAASTSINVYLGASEEGVRIMRLIESECEKKHLSVSEFVKGCILKELEK